MKLLVLAFDGMGYHTLIEKYLEEMPFLSRLKQEGVYGFYASEYCMTLPSWTSIYTGMTQEHHKVKNSVTSMLTAPMFPRYWEILGDAGLTQGVFGMPLTYPPAYVNGWMVSGFPSPEHLPKTMPAEYVKCYPADYAPSLKDYSCTLDVEKYADADAAELLKAFIVLIAKNLGILNMRFLEYLRPDCLSVGFQLHDMVLHGKNVTEKVKHDLCSFTDELIGSLVANLHPERFLIVADHGSPCESPTTQHHYADASLFIGGKDVVNRCVQGVVPALDLAINIHEWDIMPLILRLCNVPVPDNIDGKAFPILKGEVTDTEKEAMENQLRSLGYFD